MPSNRRLDNHYILMQVGFWAMYGAFCGYQTALLLSRGFSNGQAGVIIAFRCLAGIICQPVLGGFADRHPEIPLRRIVSLSLVVGLIANCVLYAVHMGMAGTAALFVLIGGFELSAYPLMDAMAVQFINVGVPIRYSFGRGMGSFAYAVTCVLMGLLVGRFGVEYTLLAHAALVAVEIALVAAYPVYRGGVELRDQGSGRPHSVLQLLRMNPGFTMMLAAALFALTGVLVLSNFLVNVVVDRGGRTSQLGLALFLMAAAELPAGMLFPKLLARLGSGRLLAVSFAGMLAKVLAIMAAPSLIWLYVAQPIQMVGYGLFTPASVYFVNESVPVEDRVRGQTLMMVASNGLGGMLGSLLGGAILDWGGVTAMLSFCVACCGLSILIAAAALRLGRRQ